MWIEFEQSLADCLAGVKWEDEQLSEAFREERVRVTACPRAERGVMSSDIALRLARIAARSSRAISAREIGVKIVSQLGEIPLFEVQVGDHGHLNARPTAKGVIEFLNRAAFGENGLLLQERSFLVARGAIGEPKRLSLNMTPELLKEAERRNSDVAELLACRCGRLSRDDLLMALALGADPELSVRPYLQGLFGRQNIPWLVQRFFAVARQTSRHAEPLNRPVRIEDFGFGVIDHLLEFRTRYLETCRGRRPWEVIAMVLELIYSFFEDYQSPRCRSALAEREGDCLFRCLSRIAVRQIGRAGHLVLDSSSLASSQISA